jgi:hypothetical protein
MTAMAPGGLTERKRKPVEFFSITVHFRAVLRTFLKKRRKVDFEQWQLSRFNTDDIYYFCPIKPPRSVVAPLDDLEKFDNPIML